MKLFFIGNGFDLDHNLKTQYIHFKEYLEENYIIHNCIQLPNYGERSMSLEETANFIYNMIDISSCDEKWSDLEAALGKLDYSLLINLIDFDMSSNIINEIIRNNQDNIDYYSTLLDGFNELITEWLLFALQSPCISNDKYKRIFSDDSIFLTFNYTDTLEVCYRVPQERICHIHGKINENLIIGHGEKSSNFSNQSIIGIEEEIDSIHKFLYKDTRKIINDHKNFFEKIKNVDEIFFIGWSFSDIDIGYLNKVIEVLNGRKVIIHFTEYDSDNSNGLNEKKRKLGNLCYEIGQNI